MKKTLIAATLAALTSNAMAISSGGYMGISAGVQSFLPKTTITDVDGTDTIFITEGTSDFSTNIFIGYTYFFDSMWGLGINLDAQIIKPHTSFNITGTDILGATSLNISTKLKNSLGLSARGYYSFNDSSAGYLVLGYRRGKIDYTATESGTDAPVIGAGRSLTSDGFEYGLGAEIEICPQVTLRFEATQTQYGNQTVFNSTSVGSYTNNSRVNQASLGILWYPDWI